MAKKVSAKGRALARKQRDKWKMKRWYTIRAPRHPWDFKNIGETLGESDESIVGRVYEMTLQEFNGDFTKMHVILRFRVHECVGQDALTTFIGHHHQTDHTRRQIRRYRGKIDDVVDVVTTDGYLVRLKPLIITQKRVQTSVKQVMRSKTRELLLGYAAKNTYSKLQESILGGELEEDIRKAVKPIYPIKSVAIRKSQLLQSGVVTEKGPTLDEIHAEEKRVAAELKAKKAAALEAAMEEDTEEDSPSILDAAEAMEPESEKQDAEEDAPAVEESAAEAAEEVSEAEAVDYSSMTVAELKELLKAAGKPVSGKKADLISRLEE
ncbi:MAG TPA: 30S ribosomal protein S3ae [Candidatus Poseidoniaceae archaeon]|nr:MAG TPA: 30S ribosomal protein S3ae [Candidatus Poseidoniales archaeon]DAC58363.1 MAG TPA: 30S ribosomal protein S3ae [Candidatus Poseidoniales archaeon]HII22647.1 30S ribosomal protein S3ae [Candidatus Poseidoniaceae archaeon]HII50837.1 30S ribosomal protein S3ae [Candidatus Poseidoniaceae archaeon]|tara:strand:- start:676 stop:1644 length:969 start_codon:yes stop_codon:yes gene_type:complete